jgi:hypothetical protein
MYPAPDGQPADNADYARKPVTIHNARSAATLLDQEGYIAAPCAKRGGRFL